MRMSTSMMYQQNMTGITGNQSLFMKAAEQLSTGKKVINPSDDPLAASRAVMLSQSQAENNQYTLARTFARQSVSMEETVLSGATSTISDIKALIVNAGGTESDNDRDSLATQLQGLKDQLLNQPTVPMATDATCLAAMRMISRRLSILTARLAIRAAIKPWNRRLTPTVR